MNTVVLALRSAIYHRRMHLGLVAGTIIACATLTGSLIVGDSVRHTLYSIATSRLGNISHAVDWGNRFFDARLAEPLQKNPDLAVAAVLALRGVAESPPEKGTRIDRLNRAWIYGVDNDFWRLAAPNGEVLQPGPQEACINLTAASALKIRAGDDLILRLQKPSQIPAEAPLASKTERDSVVARIRIIAVLSEDQGGRFSLSANQAAPANIYVNRQWLGEFTDITNKANLLVAGPHADGTLLQRALEDTWQVEQAGFRLRTHPGGIVQLESERLFLEDAVLQAARRLGTAQPMLTYLVNRIAKGDNATPYSFVTAGTTSLDIPEGAVSINQWLADNLKVTIGDVLRLSWYEPLSNGEFIEKHGEAPVHKVLPMDALSMERDLAPVFPGLSGVDSCKNWDIGLPLDESELSDEANEAYWKDYGQTPKLVASFNTGSSWWGNHFGTVMAVRFPAGETDANTLALKLRDVLNPADIGLVFNPVRQSALNAVQRSLNFGALFTGMSMFLIASSLVLISMIYMNGLQMRSKETGMLLALGWPMLTIRKYMVMEWLPGLLTGAVLGALAGIVYARLLLYGLERFWPDAVADTPIQYHVSLTVMAQGAIITISCVMVVLAACVWRSGRHPIRELLQRDFSVPRMASSHNLLMNMLLLAPALSIGLLSLFFAVNSKPEHHANYFFITGMAILITGLSSYNLILKYAFMRPANSGMCIRRMVFTHLARRRGRSLGMAIVTACGVFMIISVAIMQAATVTDIRQRQSGTGGFSVFAETTSPVLPENALVLGLSQDVLVPLRVREGDDAGCLNLNRAQQPRIYGVNPEFLIKYRAFAPAEEAKSLWSLLNLPLGKGVFPALVGDSDTAMWGLQARTEPDAGTEYAYADGKGETFHLRTVGKLPMRLSLFQGAILISEENFSRLFPHESGYRAFLIDSDNGSLLVSQLNREYGRLGMEALLCGERLRNFHSVERAYLAMFLILGGLGIMLGAGGAAVMSWRILAERRAESALLVAMGYQPGMVRRIALIEHTLLVSAGLFIGVIAAGMASFPLLLQSQLSVGYFALTFLLFGISVAYLFAVISVVTLSLHRIPLSALRTE